MLKTFLKFPNVYILNILHSNERMCLINNSDNKYFISPYLCLSTKLIRCEHCVLPEGLQCTILNSGGFRFRSAKCTPKL